MALIMVFKLIKNAEQTWRRLHGSQQLSKLVLGIQFSDGVNAESVLN
jgi:putative transposase